MPVHSVMTPQHGDVKFSFEADDKAAVKVAMERFNDLVKTQKMWAATPATNGNPGRVLKSFDPAVDVIFMRQLQGG